VPDVFLFFGMVSYWMWWEEEGLIGGLNFFETKNYGAKLRILPDKSI